jgi:hypothetical protein
MSNKFIKNNIKFKFKFYLKRVLVYIKEFEDKKWIFGMKNDVIDDKYGPLPFYIILGDL